jgi:uncharacterized protein YjbJ (UPF0337 family)
LYRGARRRSSTNAKTGTDCCSAHTSGERERSAARLGITRHAPDQLHTAKAMNEDQIKGQWEQLKGKFKRAWAELTDDDFLRAEGSIDKMYGIIQERFGDTRDDIRKKLDRV